MKTKRSFFLLQFALACTAAATLEVRLLPSCTKDAMMRERTAMEAMHPLALTRTFRANAGLAPLAEDEFVASLGGWEAPDMEIRGHTCGHWLSGMASLYEATKDASVRNRAAEVVHILHECQNALGNGYLSAFPESDIDKIIRGERVWAPWYVIHKIFAGLLDQYEICGNEEALAVAARLGDWACAKVLPLSPEEAATMRKREFGGIAESLLVLSRITGEDKYRAAAGVFHDPAVMDALDAREDRLNGRHANTFIPKVIADMEMWRQTGDDAARARAEFFWETVLAHYMYAPGCVSTKEAFRGPDRQGDFLTGVTGETCCTYNLLKLSRRLFAADPRPKIADYQERALWNHILAQMEPVDGRLTYFLPVATGTYKLQHRSNDAFWCCCGSAMESHTRYHRMIFAEKDGTLYLNNFIPCIAKWNGLEIRLATDFPAGDKATLEILSGEAEASIAVRTPFWAASNTTGRSFYKTCSRRWKKGDIVEVDLRCSLRTESPAGAPERKAVFYGPILMVGRLGTDGMRKNALRSQNYYTHDYTIPGHLRSIPFEPLESWTRISGSRPYERGMDGASPEIPESFPDPVFTTPSGLEIVPFYSLHSERYVMYFN
ncbi:MAG: glycoside hydrolase family 127 protein [Kiritimatiellae bacterium]|nr:glycoside hydrolase family 127 protein [Kiritimatiellia bacterium]